MCLRISRRNTTSAGVPNRPRLRLLGWRNWIWSEREVRAIWCTGLHAWAARRRLAEGLVHGRYHLLIRQHLIGVPHPVFAQIAHLFGDQAVAEAALCTPHLNHVACAGTSTPQHPGAVVHD